MSLRVSPTRLESLDLFRGLTIAAMILVSAPGTWEAVYGSLDHATWHGWTPTDLVFPFLLFAMGAAVPAALAGGRGGPRRAIITSCGAGSCCLDSACCSMPSS